MAAGQKHGNMLSWRGLWIPNIGVLISPEPDWATESKDIIFWSSFSVIDWSRTYLSTLELASSV